MNTLTFLKPNRANALDFFFFSKKSFLTTFILLILQLSISNIAFGNDHVHRLDDCMDSNHLNSSMVPGTFVCQGVSVPLMMLPSGAMLSLPATTFVNASSVTCPNMTFTVAFTADFDPNNPPTATEINFDCLSLGLNFVTVYGCDDQNNCTSCQTEILITANSSCGFPAVSMKGFIDDEKGEGVEDVAVSINYGQYYQMTDVDGSFDMNELEMYANYKIAPSKDIDPRNGVSTYDIVKIRKHILGIESLDSPYKIIAGDVNGSGELTALDLVMIRKLILLDINEFPNDMPSWRFVDADYIFSNPQFPLNENFMEYRMVENIETDLDDLDFVAIKLGDVSGDATPNAWISETRNIKGVINFQTQDAFLKKGENVELVFSSDQLEQISAWQATLSFDPNLIEFLSFEKIKEVYAGMTKVGEGNITLSWEKNVNTLLNEKVNLMKVKFKAKQDVFISDVIRMSSQRILATAYNDIGEEYDVHLEFEKTDQSTQRLSSFGNEPNPFSSSTIIRYFLPEKDQVEIILFDSFGKVLKTYQINGEAGYQQQIVKQEDFQNHSGLFYYKIKTSKEEANGKMILVVK